jgi:hypothetical protein
MPERRFPPRGPVDDIRAAFVGKTTDDCRDFSLFLHPLARKNSAKKLSTPESSREWGEADD